MSKKIQYEMLCPNCKVELKYKGMEDIHTGGRELEILELIGSIFLGFSVIAIRDLLVKRMTFDFYVCPNCRYTIFVEEDSISKASNSEKLDGYIEYRKRLKNVIQLMSEIKKASSV